MFLGEDLLAWLVLAVGGAMTVGNLAALAFPPRSVDNDFDSLPQASIWRCVIFAGLGLMASLWALASLSI